MCNALNYVFSARVLKFELDEFWFEIVRYNNFTANWLDENIFDTKICGFILFEFDWVLGEKSIRGGILITAPDSYDTRIFASPICSNSFDDLAVEISIDKSALYLMTVQKCSNSVIENHFCSDLKKLLTKQQLNQ